MPTLFEGKGPRDTVRVWVPGCSTGEEAYSLAILLLEHMATLTVRPKTVVFATDIDEPAIAVARHAHYPAAMLQDVGPERLDRYFAGDGISYTLAKEVRDLCIFSSHSVIRDPPFSRIDLISCRNLLIYLDRELQNQLLAGVSLRAAAGRIPVSRLVGSADDAGRAVRAGRQEISHLSPARSRRRPSRPAAGAAQRAAAGRRNQAHRQEPYRPAAAAYRREPGSRTVRAGACRRDARRRRRAFFDADRQISRKRARRPDTQYRRDGAARIAARPADRADRGGRDASPGRAPGAARRDRRPGAVPRSDDRAAARSRRRAAVPDRVLRYRRADSARPAPAGADRRTSRPPTNSSNASCARRASGCNRGRGVRNRARGTEIGERGAGLDQRGAAIDQRGTRNLARGSRSRSTRNCRRSTTNCSAGSRNSTRPTTICATCSRLRKSPRSSSTATC